MKNLLILLIALFIYPAVSVATVVLVASDPETKDYGMIFSSSGLGISTVANEGGMAGYGGSGGWEFKVLQETEALLMQGKNADQVSEGLTEKFGDNYYRVTTVSADGSVDSLVPKRGCRQIECGAGTTSNYSIAGGGMKSGVLKSTYDYYQSLTGSEPLVCKLLKTITKIYELGGESAIFVNASIDYYDAKARKRYKWKGFDYRWPMTHSPGPQPTTIIPMIVAAMKADGYECPSDE